MCVPVVILRLKHVTFSYVRGSFEFGAGIASWMGAEALAVHGIFMSTAGV